MNEAPKGLEYYKTADEYVAAWREFVAPFEKALGVRAHAYDPGVAFKRTDGHHDTLDMPAWALVLLRPYLLPDEEG
jgi:hypothetical protein